MQRLPLVLLSLVWLALATLAPTARTQTPPGETVWGANRYVEYQVGNAPIVISSAHGGYLKPSNIPDRTFGVIAQDRLTQELARRISTEVTARTGRHPHLVISHLHRSKLDPNREIVEAAQGNVIAERAWRDFHRFVSTATSTAMTQWGRGHYVDIHGHAHPLNWTELGYALTASELDLSDEELNDPTFINKSTLRAIGGAPGTYFPGVLRGTTSIGGLLEQAGYSCVPSPAIPTPGTNPYFNGGFNVRRHTSRVAGTVDGTQIELPFSIRGNVVAQVSFARNLATALSSFVQTHYGFDPGGGTRITITTPRPFAREGTGAPAQFEVRRTGSIAEPAVVAFDVSGRAQAGGDYAALGTTLLIPAGRAVATLDVQPIDDTLAEGNETVTVQLRGGVEIGAPSQASALILDDEGEPNLEAHWALDETSGGTAGDRSGNGHQGALQPSAATGPQWGPARHRGGLQFDEVDDHVRVPNFAYAPTGDFTVAFWFRAPPSAETSFQYAFGHGAFGVPDSLNIYFSETTGRVRAALVFSNDLADGQLIETDANLRDDTWHHFALVGATSDLCTMFVDGALAAQAQLGGDALRPNDPLYLGNRFGLSATRFYGGRLDDVRVYARGLAPIEIQALAQATPPVSQPLGTACAGTRGTPELDAPFGATLGGRWRLRARNGPATQPAVLALGTSTQLWLGLPLPLGLAAVGAAGCTVWTGPEVWLPTVTNPAGTAMAELPMPVDPSLLGAELFAQWWLVDPGANPLGVILTNGLASVVGGVE
ncbi:MAG: LamG-like jellyroll fold domain-containing protein [Planctomycetota bacterium]